MKKRLNHTAAFRKMMCISQHELARYLGISYSTLAMQEKEQRELPARAMIKLGQLMVEHEQVKKLQQPGLMPAALQAAIDMQRADLLEKIARQHFMDDNQAKLLAYELKQLQTKQQGALAWLHLVPERLQAESDCTAADREWLQKQQYRVSELVLENAPTLLQLPLQIALLQAKVAVYEKMLQEAKGLTAVDGDVNHEPGI